MRKRLCCLLLVVGLGSQVLTANEVHAGGLSSVGLVDDAQFGQSVDVDGAMAVVGAPGARSGAGTAFVFERSSSNTRAWVRVVELISPEGFSGTRFGERVAINGTTVVVGTGGANVGANTAQGQAFVFGLQAAGAGWTATHLATLQASDGAANDRFGHAVDVDGDTVVVGAPLRNDAFFGADRGGSYVFVRPTAGWSGTMTQTGKLDFFGNCGLAGWDVAIDGDTIVQGIPGECTRGPATGGAAVYLKGAAWSDRSIETAMLQHFGPHGSGAASSVDVDGDEIVLGAPGYSNSSGRALIFTKPGNGWQQTIFPVATLQASDAAASDDFGREVSIEGGRVIVGAPLDDFLRIVNTEESFSTVDQGSFYGFRRPAAGWPGNSGVVTEALKHDPRIGNGDRFGESVAFDGGVTVVGAPYRESGSMTDVGAAYVFDLPTVRVSDSIVTEGGTATFTITLSDEQLGPVTVDTRTQDDSANAGSDYVARAPSAVTIPAGETSVTIDVETLDDTVDEPEEWFRVVLSNPSGAFLGQSSGIGVLRDNDLASISVGDAIANEGSPLGFTISLAHPAGENVEVSYEAGATGDTAQVDADYSATSGTTTISAGQSSTVVSVPTIDDALVESDETVTLTLTGSSANATIVDGTGGGTITSDDSYPTLSITDRSRKEGNTGLRNFIFTVKLSDAFGAPVTVNYSTATPPSGRKASTTNDYVPQTNEMLTFAAGETSKTVTIQVRGDKRVERDERFLVTLSAPTNATVADGNGAGTIKNDD